MGYKCIPFVTICFVKVFHILLQDAGLCIKSVDNFRCLYAP